MLNELEQKIRKSIPELNELGVWCEFKCLKTKDEFVFIEQYNEEVMMCYNKSEQYVISFSYIGFLESDRYEIIGKPIQLNHVLEYSLKSKYENGVNMMFEYEQNELLRNLIIKLWNLKSNLLSEQSEELIKFINEL